MLAVAVDRAADVTGDEWAYEFKWDGVRALVEVEPDGGVRLFARSGNEITAAYPELAGLGEALAEHAPCVLDGEVVALDDEGRPSFEALQPRMHLRDPGRVARAATQRPVVLMLFDVLELDGRPLVDLPYTTRRERLEALELRTARWQTPPSHRGDAERLLQAARDNRLEGMVAKRLRSPYRPGTRSDDWRKLRLYRREPFVVGGYLSGEGGRSSTFGSLLVGYHDADGDLRYAGSVGSGFTDDALAAFQQALDSIVVDASPFADEVPVARGKHATFVEPRLVIEVQFSEWTRSGTLRPPSYKALRSDLAPAEVVHEAGTADGPPVRDTDG